MILIAHYIYILSIDTQKNNVSQTQIMQKKRYLLLQIHCIKKCYCFCCDFFICRKTPVHKFYSASGLTKIFSAVTTTKGPPTLPPLPQGFHHLYTHIEYGCTSSYYHHTGSTRRTCLKTGKWSGRHVSCSPGEKWKIGQTLRWLENIRELGICKPCDSTSY